MTRTPVRSLRGAIVRVEEDWFRVELFDTATGYRADMLDYKRSKATAAQQDLIIKGTNVEVEEYYEDFGTHNVYCASLRLLDPVASIEV